MGMPTPTIGPPPRTGPELVPLALDPNPVEPVPPIPLPAVPLPAVPLAPASVPVDGPEPASVLDAPTVDPESSVVEVAPVSGEPNVDDPDDVEPNPDEPDVEPNPDEPELDEPNPEDPDDVEPNPDEPELDEPNGEVPVADPPATPPTGVPTLAGPLSPVSG